MPSIPHEPRIAFLIGGAQKSGTSALAHYLRAHPGLRLPARKEAHVFDAPDFNEDWGRADIDARYAQLFDDARADALYGDATPIYLLHPRFIARIARYNPAMRWVVLLRDPVARAVSHYHMERGRGDETWPLWPAMLLERLRLHGHADDFSEGSPLRHHSYRARGDYARQLDALYAQFPHEQVLLLRSDELLQDAQSAMQRVQAFLGVPTQALTGTHAPVFVGDYAPLPRGGLRMRMLRWLMRHELRAMRERHGLAFD